MKLSTNRVKVVSGTKIKCAFNLTIWCGILLAIGRVLLLINKDNYTFTEIKYFYINYLQSSINYFTFYAIFAGLLLVLIWIIFNRLEGFLVAGLSVFLPLLPIAYYLNTRYFPGIFEPSSIIGNSILGLSGLTVTIVVFKRWFFNCKIFKRLYHNWVFITSLIIIIATNIVFILQPEHLKLQAASSTPVELIKLFERDLLQSQNIAGNNNTEKDKSTGTLLQNYFSLKFQNRVKKIQNEITYEDSVKIVQYANLIENRQFDLLGERHKLAENINWRKNPSRDREWILALNRQDWLLELTTAYLITNDDKYTTAFQNYIESWLHQNPPLRWKDESDSVWRLIETSSRITNSWIDVFAIIVNSDKVSDDVKWRMLASFHDHAQFLAHFRSPSQNHLLQETFGLMAVAGAFPEFKMSNHWLKIANMRLDNFLKTEVYPDGGYNEVSTYYHRFVIRILQQIVGFAGQYDVKLSEYFYETLQDMYTFLMYVSKPDGTMPAMNDGFHAKNMSNLYDQPAMMFAKDDFRFMASGGKEGHEPAERSKGFPFSGIYVMRSDWTEQARFMIIDAGLFGSAHGHEDKLSFELSAFGKPFIIESGTYTYVYNQWHKYFESSFSHNTIVVDSQSQLRQANPDSWITYPPKKLPNVWYSNQNIDYLESQYDKGYGNRKENILEDIEHIRRILFVKPNYWILWDVVKGRGEHSVSQLFHFASELELELENEKKVLLSYPNGPELTMLTLHPETMSVNKFEGMKSPIQGWISPEYGVKIKAPVLENKVVGSLPQVFLNVLIPAQHSGELEVIETELLPVYVDNRKLQESEAIAIKVDFKQSIDYILIAPNVTGEKKFDEFKTNSELFLIRKFVDGEILKEDLDANSLKSNYGF